MGTRVYPEVYFSHSGHWNRLEDRANGEKPRSDGDTSTGRRGQSPADPHVSQQPSCTFFEQAWSGVRAKQDPYSSRRKRNRAASAVLLVRQGRGTGVSRFPSRKLASPLCAVERGGMIQGRPTSAPRYP